MSEGNFGKFVMPPDGEMTVGTPPDLNDLKKEHNSKIIPHPHELDV